MGAQPSTEVSKCRELVDKHKEGKTVEWQEFLDLAAEIERSMLFNYRKIEAMRFFGACRKLEGNQGDYPDYDARSDGDCSDAEQNSQDSGVQTTLETLDELAKVGEDEDKGEDKEKTSSLESEYRDRVWEDIQTYVVPRMTPEEKEEMEGDVNKDNIQFQDIHSESITLLETQYEIECGHFILEMIRSSKDVDEFVAKYGASARSQDEYMQKAAMMLSTHIDPVPKDMVGFWFNRV